MKKKSLFVHLFILLPLLGFAADDGIPDKPSPPRLVNNLSKEFPDFLTPNETGRLEKKLEAYNDSTSNQITIVIVDDLSGYEVADFTNRLGDKWGVGQGKFDNGVVILIKPTGGQGQRDAFIAVGYGLEDAVPDIVANHITDDVVIPALVSGKYYAGLDKATDLIIGYASGKYKPEKIKDGLNGKMLLLVLAIILFFIFISYLGRNKHYTYTGRGLRRGGGWGGWGGPTFGGGGWSRGGGGFGGFGGGSFGGGGAGGKW